MSHKPKKRERIEKGRAIETASRDLEDARKAILALDRAEEDCIMVLADEEIDVIERIRDRIRDVLRKSESVFRGLLALILIVPALLLGCDPNPVDAPPQKSVTRIAVVEDRRIYRVDDVERGVVLYVVLGAYPSGVAVAPAAKIEAEKK